MFLSIHDYIGRHAGLFLKKGFVERLENGVLLVESGLLRAVHHIFTTAEQPGSMPAKKVLALAKAFRDIAGE